MYVFIGGMLKNSIFSGILESQFHVLHIEMQKNFPNSWFMYQTNRNALDWNMHVD